MSLKKRTGNECKKVDCRYYKKRNIIGGGSMTYCKECKWAHVSQYTKV